MNIGILTYHYASNYGAILQAYALWRYLTNQGHSAEIIDYRPLRAVRFFWLSMIPRQGWKGVLRFIAINRFLKRHARLSPRRWYLSRSLRNAPMPYDALLCGSDQIWDFSVPFRGLDPAFYLALQKNGPVRKISYGPSFGSVSSLGEKSGLMAQCLADFFAVSVRDGNSQRLLKDTRAIQAQKVLDPTFLVDWDGVVDGKAVPDNAYLVLHNDSGYLKPYETDFICRLAKGNNWRIVATAYPHPLADQNLLGLGPAQWLGCLKGASFIVTNSYHGMIFSIRFQKPFAVLARTDKSHKVEDLLDGLGLRSRILRESTQTKQPLPSNGVDYGRVQAALTPMLEQSQQFLARALHMDPVVAS